MQFLLRAVRQDGGVQQWFVGTDGRAPLGERGFQLPSSSALRGSFGGADYGPVRVDSLARLEIALAQLPNEPTRVPNFVGLPLLSKVGDADEGERGVLASDGSRFVLATALKVVTVDDAVPGRQTWRVVVVGSREPERAQLAELHAFDGVQLLNAAGQPVDGLSFVVLDLHIVVPDHR